MTLHTTDDKENMDYLKCLEMRCGASLNYITTVDFSIDFAYEDNVSYEKLKCTVDRSFRVDMVAFVLCMKGSLTLMLNMDEYVMKENDIIVFLPHSFIKINDISPDTVISFVGFSSALIKDSDFYNMFYRSVSDFYNSPVLSLSVGMAAFFQESFSLWGNLHKISEISMDRDMIKDAMYTSFHTILCLFKKGIGVNMIQKKMALQDSHHITRIFVRLSMQYYSSEHSLAFYADKINVSVPYLCRFIKQRLGKTPLDIISSFIVLDAQTQLKTTNRPIKDIAIALGFSNSTAFCRFFRKNVLISPMEYRKGA